MKKISVSLVSTFVAVWILTIVVETLPVKNSRNPQWIYQNGRQARGFKPLSLSTARGFGKRDGDLPIDEYPISAESIPFWLAQRLRNYENSPNKLIEKPMEFSIIDGTQ